MTDHPIPAAAGAAVGAALVVLGIPLGALCAALLGAGFSSLHKPALAEDKVPMRLLGVVMDAFLGGWLAVALCNVPYTARFIGEWETAPVVLAGLLAFVMQALRLKTAGYFDRAFQAALNAVVGFFAKGKGAE